MTTKVLRDTALTPLATAVNDVVALKPSLETARDNLITTAAGAVPYATTSAFPAASSNTGKAVWDTSTGDVYKSDGATWVKLGAVLSKPGADLNYEQATATLTPDAMGNVTVCAYDGTYTYGISGFRLIRSADLGMTWDATLHTFTSAEGGILRFIRLTGWVNWNTLVITKPTGNARMWLAKDDGTKQEVTAFPAVPGRTGAPWHDALLDGLLCAANGDVYLAEYMTSGTDPDPDPVLWRLPKDTTTPQIALTGTGTRHFHFVRQSPNTGRLYVSAGDAQLESRMYMSTDGTGASWTQSPQSSTYRAYSMLFIQQGGVNYCVYGEDQEPTNFHPNTQFHRFVDGDFSTRETAKLTAKGTLWSHVKLGDDLFIFTAPELTTDATHKGIYLYHSRDGLNWREAGGLLADTSKAQSADPPRISQVVPMGSQYAWVTAVNTNLLSNGGTTANIRLRVAGQARHGAMPGVGVVEVSTALRVRPGIRYVDITTLSDFGEGGLDYRSKAGYAGLGTMFSLRADAAFSGFIQKVIDKNANTVFSVTAAGLPSFKGSKNGVELPFDPTGFAQGAIAYDSTALRAFVRSFSSVTNKHYWLAYRGEVTGDPGTLQDGEFWFRSDLRRFLARVGGVTYHVGATLNLPVKTGSYNLTTADDGVLANVNFAGANLNLQAAANMPGREVIVKNINASNAVNVVPSGSETIDGVTGARSVTAGGVLRLYCDGTAWYVL